MSHPNRFAPARLRAFVGLVAVAFAIAACGSDGTDDAAATSTAAAATSEKPKVVFDQAFQDKFDKILNDQFAASGLPGVLVSMTIGDQKWVKSLGVGNLEKKTPILPDDNFRIASISKTFTATAILQLVDEKKLSLDDTLEPFVAGIPNGDKITIRNLLGMQSGIYDFTADDGFEKAFGENPTLPWTPQQAVDIMKQRPADFEPGTKTVYCDSNYILLGLILEKVTGKTAAEVINEQVVAKLPGLANTNFPTGISVPDPHPTAYTPDPADPSKPQLIVDDVNPQVGWTAGAMTSTLDDLEAWGRELTDETLLSPELKRERLQSNRIDGAPINLGYGLGVMTINDLVGHNGAILGYSSIVLRLPNEDATFVALGNSSTNSSTATTEIVLSLIQALYPDQIK